MKVYAAYFKLEKEIERQLQYKEDEPLRRVLVSSYTDRKKDSLRQLSSGQYQSFLAWLKRTYNIGTQQDPNNAMRRKIWRLLENMGYDNEHKKGWYLKYGKYHKPIQAHSYKELQEVVSQLEIMYKSHIEQENKLK